MADESWLPIAGYEGRYEVSNLGRVRSLDRVRSHGRRWKGRILKPNTTPGGYLIVNLYLDNAMRSHTVHRLVLTAFVGPASEGHEALHRDGDPLNNALGNLSWGTRSENTQDQIRHGTHIHASKTHCPAGHPYDGDNLYVRPGTTHRRCRECQRAYRDRNREAVRAKDRESKRRQRARAKTANAGKAA